MSRGIPKAEQKRTFPYRNVTPVPIVISISSYLSFKGMDMDGEHIEEREVLTPTVIALRQSAADRGMMKRKPYLFVISEHDLHKLRLADVPVSACVVFAAIRGAVRAAGDDDWVTISPRAMDALRHSFRWWWRHTEALERAGFIEVERHRGRLPRYRLKPQADAA